MIYRIDCKTVELASSFLPLQWSWFSSRQRSLSCDWQINFALFGRGSRCFVNFLLWVIWFQQLLLRLLHVRKISIKSRRRVFWEYYSRNLSTSASRQPKMAIMNHKVFAIPCCTIQSQRDDCFSLSWASPTATSTLASANSGCGSFSTRS